MKWFNAKKKRKKREKKWVTIYNLLEDWRIQQNSTIFWERERERLAKEMKTLMPMIPQRQSKLGHRTLGWNEETWQAPLSATCDHCLSAMCNSTPLTAAFSFKSSSPVARPMFPIALRGLPQSSADHTHGGWLDTKPIQFGTTVSHPHLLLSHQKL